MVAICEFCGKEFKKYPSSKKKYCSKECSIANRSKKVKYVKFTCEQCGKNFYHTEREVKNAKSKNQKIRFCSKKCKSDFWGKDRVEVACPVCGKKFLQQKRLVHENHCCSPECSAKNPANRLLMGQETTLICKHCGKPFNKKVSYIKKQEKRGQPVLFCSRKCFNDYIHPDTVKVKCKNCEKIIKVTKDREDKINFCDIDCRLDYYKKQKITLICKHCGKTFEAIQSQKDKKFCSQQCFDEYRRIIKDTYAKLQHYLRSSLNYRKWHSDVLRRANWKCEDCGAYNNLNVHHKNELYNIALKYNFNIQEILNSKEFNDVDNGECLCIDCHIKRHPYNIKLINLKGQYCRRKFKAAKKLTTIRTELNGKTGEIRNPNRRR